MKVLYLIFLLAIWNVFPVDAQRSIDNPAAHYAFSGNYNDERQPQFDATGRNVGFGLDNRGNGFSAGYFNGVSSWVTARPVYSGMQAMTISALVLPFTDKQHSNIFYIGNSASSGFGLLIKKANTRTPGNNVVFQAGGLYEYRDTTLHLPANQWHHFVVTKQGDNFKVYLNGERIFSETVDHSAATSPLYIGSTPEGNSIWQKAFEGMIDEVKFYEYALDSTEILRLYAQESGSVSPALATITGKAYYDVNRNCSYDGADVQLGSKSVTVQPGGLVVPLDSAGNYTARVDAGAAYTLGLLGQEYFRVDSVCQVTTPVLARGDSALANVGAQGAACYKLNVNLGSTARRRCFKTRGSVTVRNDGVLASPATIVELTYPSTLNLVSASAAQLTQVDHTFSFAVPSVAGGQQYTIYTLDSTSCRDSITGTLACVQARLLAARACPTYAPGWDGAELTASARCGQPGQAVFVVRNVGNAAMADSTQARFFVSDGLVASRRLKLGAGDSAQFVVDVNGVDWAFTVDQTPNHIGATQATAFAPGCGLLTPPPNEGLRTAVGVANVQEAEDEECLPIVDSYDPNDIAVSPAGFGQQSQVLPKTRLTYKIRFQNYGTASTEFVRIVDTLPAGLDITSIEHLTASHPGLQFSVYKVGGRYAARWFFPRIALTPARQDSAASQGFVTFAISPISTIPPGTAVTNSAAIFFDYNRPVLTNQVLTTFDIVAPSPTQPGSSVLTTRKSTLASQMHLYPNPAQTELHVALPAGGTGITQVMVFTPTGQQVLSRSAFGTSTTIPVASLAPGLYTVMVRSSLGQAARQISIIR